LYYIALGQVKLERFTEAKENLDTLLIIEPHNKQAIEIREHVKEKIKQGNYV
jgi:hypothetical protein